MKKVLGVAALAAFATSAMAVTVDVRVVTTGNANTAQANASVPVMVQAQLSAGSAGLALIGFNVDVTPAGGASDADLCDTSGFLLMAPVSMQSFDRKNLSGAGFSNEGLTNPSSSPNLSGYSGTCDGNGKLLQLGGGQNTIGNTPGGAPYPIGAVVQNIGNSGWTTIATGEIDASSLSSGQWVISVDTVFANTINAGQVSAPFAVSEATVGTTSSLTINLGTLCADADVNCSGTVNAVDIGIVANGANFQKNPPACDRADVTNDGLVTAVDIGVISSGANFQTSTGACVCVTSTPAACGAP